jgi:2-polyprenyl-3-methyl-5-hydroxy-6-metoxy-1,4-benzoquinol methylase
MNCPICGSEATIKVFRLFDDRYGYPGSFELYRCSSCGHKSLTESFSDVELIRLYTEYYPRSTFDEKTHQPHKNPRGLKAWLRGDLGSAYCWVPENVRVLDIGCGFGESLGYHRNRGCDAYGVEADRNAQRVAAEYGYRIHTGLFDPEIYPRDFFDYITLDQVIEHVVDPLTTMRGIAQVLKKGGTVILSTPNSNGWGARCFGRHWINWHVPYHLQHFSIKSLQLAAEQAGLELTGRRSITKSDWLLFQWLHLALYPEQGKPSVFWKQTEERRIHQKIAAKCITLVHRTGINHLVTRFFDLLGVGDNHVLFLRKR